MRNRLFLLALLAALILIQAVLRSAAMSTPFHGGSTLGGYTFWELRGVLPLGVFAAGSLLFLSAAAAQCAQAVCSCFNIAVGFRTNQNGFSIRKGSADQIAMCLRFRRNGLYASA